jgi:hypothetical protein
VLQDDPRAQGYNVDERVKDFETRADEWFSQLRGDDVIFMMGSDFLCVDRPLVLLS